MNDPSAPANYLLNWNNKLDLGDAELAVIDETTEGKSGDKSMILSYKMIGYNTYNVVAIDLVNNCLIKYWHESYALWESPVRGFLLANNDFLVISKDGTQVLVLGDRYGQPNKVLTDSDNQKRMIHSLTEVDYLKVENRNHIMFACQFYEDRQICVQEQYKDTDRFTRFNDLFRIKIHEITLRELLLIQSIYLEK